MAADPSAATLSECHVIRTAVLETLRLSAHAIGAVRTVAAEGGFTLDDKYWAAPGETIALAHIAVHRSEAIWGPNCKRFSLDRKEYEPLVADDPNNEYVMVGDPAGGSASTSTRTRPSHTGCTSARESASPYAPWSAWLRRCSRPACILTQSCPPFRLSARRLRRGRERSGSCSRMANLCALRRPTDNIVTRAGLTWCFRGCSRTTPRSGR